MIKQASDGDSLVMSCIMYNIYLQIHPVNMEKTKEHINKNDMNKYLIRSLQNFKLKKIKNLFLIQNFKYDNKKNTHS